MPENKDGVLLPIEWHISEEVTTKYATNLVIQHTEHEFIISFFEIYPPVLLGPPEGQKLQAEMIDTVRAECVARIVVASDRMPEFVRVLQDNLGTYQEKDNG